MMVTLGGAEDKLLLNFTVISLLHTLMVPFLHAIGNWKGCLILISVLIPAQILLEFFHQQFSCFVTNVFGNKKSRQNIAIAKTERQGNLETIPTFQRYFAGYMKPYGNDGNPGHRSQ